MRPMTFTLAGTPRWKLDLSPLTPERLARLGGDKTRISALKITHGGRETTLGEWFQIGGEDVSHIELRRTGERVSRIGENMRRGRITVRAHGGGLLGRNLSGGVIRVHGDCGEQPGRGMRGGAIEIGGDCGERPGAGMRGGRITVWGDAGGRIGDTMRRGTIIVAGAAGDYIGANMTAGTILILGRCGSLPGYGMRRGSILLGGRPPLLGDTMASCGDLKMEYLRLFFKQLASLGGAYRRFEDYGPEVHRYAGDLANAGKGELLILLNAKKTVRKKTR